MANTVQPPVLLSRILTFVLATSVVVLCTLLFTIAKMTPLERPEVFFLFTPTRSATNIVIEPFVPDSGNAVAIERYKEGFIREYIIARNTISQDSGVMRRNWSTIVKPWSSREVFTQFTKTKLYKNVTFNEKIPNNISCDVDFDSYTTKRPILRMYKDRDEYDVKFILVCKNSSGQTTQENYRMQIKIQSELNGKISGTLEQLDKLRDNPLGIQVVQYNVMDGKIDPLDSDIAY